jgi:hypothetical protein
VPTHAEEPPGRWNVVGAAKHDHYGAAAALLPDGRVLLVGGYSNSKNRFERSAEIWDGHSRKTTFAGMMGVPRAGHTATTLADGRVLVVGGEREGAEESGTLDSAEIWDPKTLRFTPTGSMRLARREHQAILLDDGSVAVAGDGAGGRTMEVWSPTSGRWTEIPGSGISDCQDRGITPLPGAALRKAELCWGPKKATVSSWNANKGKLGNVAEIEVPGLGLYRLLEASQVLIATDGPEGRKWFLWNLLSNRQMAFASATGAAFACEWSVKAAPNTVLCLESYGDRAKTTVLDLAALTIETAGAVAPRPFPPFVSLGDGRVFATGSRKQLIVWIPREWAQAAE